MFGCCSSLFNTRFLSRIFYFFLVINVILQLRSKCVQAIVFSPNHPTDNIEIRLASQQQQPQQSHRVLSGDPPAYYRKQQPPPPLAQSIYFESPISYNYPNANDESLQSQPVRPQSAIVFEDVRRPPSNQQQSFAATAYEEDLQTSDLPYHLQQELPQYHSQTKELQRLKSSTSNENSLFFNQQRSYSLPSLNTVKKTSGIASIRSPVYIPFATDFGERRTKATAAAAAAVAEKKKVVASRTNKLKNVSPTKTEVDKKTNDGERDDSIVGANNDASIEIHKIPKLEKVPVEDKPSTFKPSRLPSSVVALQNDRSEKEKAKNEKEAVKSNENISETETEYEEIADDADVDADADVDEKEDDADKDYELSKPQIVSSTQVSIQTSKSVASSLRTTTTASVVPTLATENLALNSSIDNSSDNWMIVASVQTSRSVSGARFLSFPLTIQLANDSASADDDLTTPMTPKITTPTTTAATATLSPTLANSIRVLDDISKFLPANYHQASKNSIFTRSSGDQKKNGTKSNPNDAAAIVPAATKKPKININAIRPKFIENIEKFLPANYTNVINESKKEIKPSSTTLTTIRAMTATTLKPEQTGASSDSSTSSSVKIVFPTRPGNLRPIYRTTTTASSVIFSTNSNGDVLLTTARPKPRLKEWPKRQSTQFTGWPTATPETISIEKLLEAAKKQRDQELSESLTTKSAPTATTTMSTAVPITRQPQVTIRTTTPGVCAGSCDLDATVKLVGGAKWVPELLNRNTKEWQILANEVQTKLEEAFSRSELLRKWYKKIRIEEFSEGSGVLVDYYVEMTNIADDINTNKIKRMFHDSLFSSFDVEDDSAANDKGNNGHDDPSLTGQYSAKLNLGSFVIDPKFTDFIVIPKRDVSNMKNINDEDLLPQWAIAVIVIGLVSLIFVTLFGLSVLINRKKNTKIKQRLPFTEEMIHEYNKNHIMANTFDNYAVDDLYNMEDVWNEKIAFHDGENGHDDFDPHRHPGHHHHHHHHSHHNHNQDIYGGGRHLANSSGGRSSNSNGTGSGSRSGSGGSGSGYLDRNGYGNLFGGSSSSGSNNQNYHNHHHSQNQPQQQHHNHKKQRSSSSSLHDNSLSHLYDSWRSEWNGYYLNAYHNGGGSSGAGVAAAGGSIETGPIVSSGISSTTAAALATTNYNHRTLSPVQYYGNGNSSGNGAISPIGLNIGYVSRRKPDYDTNF